MKVDYILALVEAFVFVPIAMNQSVRRLKSSTRSVRNTQPNKCIVSKQMEIVKTMCIPAYQLFL